MKKFLFFGLTAFALLFAGYLAFVYYIPYSEGVRAGELIKISKKGVLMKTWEGEISQGISGAQIFSFSILDSEEKVIEDLQKFEGKYVKLNYIERYKTFPWWGDSTYFITNVQLENSPHFNK